MRAPDFWWQSPGLASTTLAPLGAVYGAIAAARLKRPGARARVPVICVGDPTVGGAGKTPTAIAIAKLLAAQSEAPYFVTRGYGGRERGPLLVDLARHAASDVGDEPLLLSRTAPAVVSTDRVAGAAFAAQAGASVIVLDDGFQNPALAKDFSLLVIDGASGVGNGRVFPAGPLRAPLLVQIERAQAIVCIGQSEAGEAVARNVRAQNVPVISAHIRPEPEAARTFAKQRVLAFAGIGRPEKFFRTLEDVGAVVVERRVFPDHHVYSTGEAHSLLAEATVRNLMLVTTEKDLVRSLRNPALAEFAATSHALPIALQFDDEKQLNDLIGKALKRRRS